jgi:hypothetical protein
MQGFVGIARLVSQRAFKIKNQDKSSFTGE